jgi:hypothetical protein
VPVLVVLFAVYAFIAAGLEAARAFSSAKAGPVIVHLLLALVDLAAGVVALAWQGRAKVSMLMAKNRRQPPPIRGPREAGIRPAQARLAQLRRSLRRGWDHPAEQPVRYRALSPVQPLPPLRSRAFPYPAIDGGYW